MPPILIYQMGKVGSTTVSKTLTQYGLKNYQIHYLSKNKLLDIKNSHEAIGKRPPEHYKLSMDVLNKNLLEAPVKIISMVRDPVARNVSAFFNNIDRFLNKKPLSTISMENLVHTFLHKYPHKIATNWFEDEFKPITGIDILSCPINNRDSYFRLDNSDIDFLLLKVEASDEMKVQALNEFIPNLGLKSLTYGNVGSDKNYSGPYERFRKEFCVPSDYLADMYGAQLIRHIYTTQEIELMRSRWPTA